MSVTDFEAALAHAEQDDPLSPATLNLRLQYADVLANASGPDCARQLAAAQTQLDTVAARPDIDFLLPLAPARIADGEYRVHLARAGCGNPPKSELQQALEAAQTAMALYRDAFDYPSAAVMQFNIAALDQQLDDADGALRALRAAIAMDRDYGLRQDATDNAKLLLQWTNQSATDADVAAMMKDFPALTATFKFNWSASDADVSIHADVTSVINDAAILSHGAASLKRQVRAVDGGWTVTNIRGDSNYDLGDWPADAKVSEWSMLYFLESALLQQPDFQVGKDGSFKSVTDAQRFAADLSSQVFARISAEAKNAGDDPAPENAIRLNISPAFADEGTAVVRNLGAAFSPGFMEVKAEQDYGLQTGTWIGARLDQGVWYQMQTPLFLPGLGLGLFTAQHDISFAFTRMVPCAAGSDRQCAEIVLHATPDPQDLKDTLQSADEQLKLSDQQSLRYWPRIDLRLVLDPDTLTPYVNDLRQSWYDGVGKSDPIIESIRTVTTFAYH
ncbi:MAG TPA: hypothetical protein VMU31_11180 [Rhizomicrobium sp.]|nr:hypothetical protein [Rhizomicrobium sp.]